jgi:REP element-mobilizing transposase RayT
VILGYHVTFGAYGFWLPNDPRGSGSHYVGAKHLLPFGPATGLADRSRSVARKEHDWRLRREAKKHLKYPAVQFTGIQARAVGQGFGELVARNGLVVWACSILPDHVHLVLGRHARPVEKVVERLKGAATHRLLEEGLHPFGHARRPNGRPPQCWGVGSWNVFLDTPAMVREKVTYVEDNPLKEGKPRQSWSFVVPYEG